MKRPQAIRPGRRGRGASWLHFPHRGWIPSLLVWLFLLRFPASVLAAELKWGPELEHPSPDTVVVRWETDAPTRGRLLMGTRAGSWDRRVEGDVSPRHALTVSGLQPGRRYHFVIGTARQFLATNSFVAGERGGGGGTLAPAGEPPRVPASAPVPAPSAGKAPPTRETWGSLPTLQDHFDRHGPDFGARDPDDYARRAWELRDRARREGLPAKVDEAGVTRIYDPKSGAFGAYNRDGTTRTFFKPRSRDYFERQPGRPVDLRSKP